MELWIGWLLFGAVVGYAAATRRGWSQAAGMLGGAMLGILSPLLFLVDGVARGDKTKVCPQCAERIKAEAKVCRYCHSPLAAIETKAPRQVSMARRAGRAVRHASGSRAK